MEGNSNEKLRIRTASPQDAKALLALYAPYVQHTAITFEYEVPSPEEFRERIRHTLERYPYLVAEKGKHILGYAYAGPFQARRAYEHSAELSIYLETSAHHRGLGKMLYHHLESILLTQNVYNLYACIACTQREDPFLPKDSPLFHEHMGFKTIGLFHQCGYKFGHWYDMIWMEKMIGEKPKQPKDFVPFAAL